VYEVEWGFSVYDILGMVGATPDVQAVQVGGPSGTLLAPVEFRRILGYEDLATGGSIIIFGKHRDLLKDVVLNFTEFFIDESCGSCSTCRIMPVVLRNKLLKILNGKGSSKISTTCSNGPKYSKPAAGDWTDSCQSHCFQHQKLQASLRAKGPHGYRFRQRIQPG
jgi:NADH:ubiquinone oxidoreductase subunit F (NADH-binding)